MRKDFGYEFCRTEREKNPRVAGPLKRTDCSLVSDGAAAIVLGVFGVLAMVLAATGLFALMAYAVSRRTREIGIRVALGAQRGQVLTTVLQRTAVLCAIGMIAGTGATLAASRLLSSVLTGGTRGTRSTSSAPSKVSASRQL